MVHMLEKINAFVWGVPSLLLILGVGIYLTFATGFAQARLFIPALRSFFGNGFRKKSGASGISSFQALCTALAATVGTGNIAGVAGAIAIGGPGSVFWMWVCSFVGMVTKFAEATLAVRYQSIDSKGHPSGGPMYMIQNGMGNEWRPLAVSYCVFGLIASFGVGNATQVNAVIEGIRIAAESFEINLSSRMSFLIGIILSIFICAALLGGAGRIGRITEKLVPLMAGGYILLGLGVLSVRASFIPEAFRAIIEGAVSPKSVTGGVVGSFFVSLRTGVSRGVFTNEAGMGTASIAYGSAKPSHPVKQGLMGIVEVFLDTTVICTITALVILCSGAGIYYGVDEGAALTIRAFGEVYGDWIAVPIALFLACFAFATLLGWGFYGARCAQFLFGERAWKVFAIAQSLIVVASATAQTGTVWLIAEIVNGLMAIPNLIALAILSPELAGLTKDFYLRYGSCAANGGTYESFNQCQPLRTLSHEKVSSSGCRGGEEGKEDPSFEHRSARSENA